MVFADRDDIFLEEDRKLVKYAPPTWAQASGHASFTVFFRVKFYVENVNQLRDPLTLHLYYLQLRQDLLGQSHSMQYCAGSPMYLDTYSSLFFPLLSLVLFITHLSPPLPPPPLPPLPITFSSLPHPLLLTQRVRCSAMRTLPSS